MSALNSKGLWWTLAGIGAVVAAKAFLTKKRTIDFHEKTVVITGGSRGLGLELARQFAQEGANVAICARDQDELDRAQEDLRRRGSDVFTYACDVTDKAQVEQFIKAVGQVLGSVDVLVNNAGTIIVSPLEHATEEDFRDTMEANFWSAFNMINAVLPQMRERKAGRIVNITSFGGKIAVPHLAPYSVSKFAFVGYSEGLRSELMKDNILVTTICPGLIRTGSPRNAFFKGQNEKEYTVFKIGDSIPFFTIAADDCAREIIDACRTGEAERVITLPAKVGAAIHGFAPGFITDMMALANEMLPGPGGIGEQRAVGKDSETALSESVVTRLTDDAAVANNEIK
ncbi:MULTISPECIES: SDR family NAD(P)-dependent oxidoreductase [Spirosoma]|uniref:SDR family oxidoreductase n=1 Tax=Spirosoma liriopis TaxID=2937440 RepID=A0ABT0HDU0_9BACT|nr:MULTISPECIES: SDR family oxidoreductase [Spirosoma]MCK8490321.1 SDR family oxidoreductase [Spirosoma liriopis]UHG89696.1 SDR family oxidoreductase [Spirosoma oryzicola]